MYDDTLLIAVVGNVEPGSADVWQETTLLESVEYWRRRLTNLPTGLDFSRVMMPTDSNARHI
jgi:hypothetical protein